jgi:hypothetical protein
MSEELESILEIVNKEAKQRYLEHADEYMDGHTIGVKCENCGHTKFNSFGYHREKRGDGLPGYVTVMYLCCEKCREMIFYIYQSLNFIPAGPGEYKPHWNIVEPSNNQIQKASLEHFEQYEIAMGERAITYVDWMKPEKTAVELIDWM